jgi:hypothetical protein
MEAVSRWAQLADDLLSRDRALIAGRTFGEGAGIRGTKTRSVIIVSSARYTGTAGYFRIISDTSTAAWYVEGLHYL